MLVLNSSPRNSQTQKFWSWKSNFNSNQRNRMLKSELKMSMIFRVWLMLNGKSSIISYKKCMMLGLRLFYLNYLLGILQLNGLQIVEYFVLEELPMKISIVFRRLQVLLFKQLLIILHLMFLELVENSKKNKLVLKDTIYLNNAQILNQLLSFWEVVLSNSLKKHKDH